MVGISLQNQSHTLTIVNAPRACYIAIPLYLVGFVVLGAAFEKQLPVAVLVIGWGLAEIAIMVGTVAVYAYCNDCFPRFRVRYNFQNNGIIA